MASFAHLPLLDKVRDLLRACGDWIRRHGYFGLQDREEPGDLKVPFPGRGGEFTWVYDPDLKKWVLELRYSFRSFECRLQAGEAEAPPGILHVHQIMRNRQ